MKINVGHINNEHRGCKSQEEYYFVVVDHVYCIAHLQITYNSRIVIAPLTLNNVMDI